ncbi:MAG: efflux RND transporter permease subunit [Marinilabiliaceae bacterium]|nr:efflux RND transporter permease subunit [Marinilabiliaceae bacterium]
MVYFLLKRPIAVIMTFIAVIVLGIVSSNLIPVSLLPDIAIPEITMQISAPEKSVQEVESYFVRPIRRQLLQVGHLNDIESTSANGHGSVRMTFKYGTDINYAFVEVNEKMDALMASMPREFERPRIIKASASDIPVFYMSVSLKDTSLTEKEQRFMELSEFCEQVIKKRIEQLPEVAMVDISGLEYPEIGLHVDLEKLNTLGIDYQSIQRTLQENDFSLGNIKVRNGMYEFNVKYASLLKNRRDIENLTIKAVNRIFKLSELAVIDVAPQSGKGIFIDKSGQSVIMAVIKKSDARMEDLREATASMMQNLKDDYPRLRFELSRNQTELLDYSISNLESSLIIGAILAFVIMLFFLKDLKSPILIGISIPISLLVSLLFFYLFNVSINIISLSGLILGVGMMIDNSIIVIDNINQLYREQKNNIFKACLKGTNEVIRPLISSVLTTCAVFVPLIFLSGISGALFYDQAIAISIGLGSSLIVSITLIPVLFRLFYAEGKRKKERAKQKSKWLVKLQVYSGLEESYTKGYDWIFAHRKQFFIGTGILLIMGFVSFSEIRKERFPSFEQVDAILSLDWNRNISLDENRHRVEEFLKTVDSLTLQVACQIGEQSFVLDGEDQLSASQASIYFQASSSERREIIQNSLEQWIGRNYPEAIFEFTPPESVFEKLFVNKEAPLEVRVWSSGRDALPSPEQLQEINRAVLNETGLNTIRKVPLQEYYKIIPRFDRIKLYDVSISYLSDILRKSLNRLQIFTLQQGQYTVPVVLTGKQENIYNVIKQLRIHTANNGSVPVSELVQVQRIAGYKLMKGDKNDVFASLGYNIEDDQLSEVTDKINQIIKQQPDLHVRYTGQLFSNRTLFNELMIVMIVALLLLYFILASQFESILQPFIVFIEIPIDIAGALLLLWVTGNSLNIMSMIGIVVMTGIIINDSILKIDTINRLVKAGYPVVDAIHTAGHKRLKPIIMTSATTILAMIPFLWGDDMGSRLQQPLAWTVIGGMTIGTFVSLYFVPLAYYYTQKRKGE